MPLQDLLSTLGDEIEDADEETFLLYSRPMPSQNLGFVDSKALSVDVTVAGTEYTIYQNPAVLASARAGGTTGAVLWRLSPLFAEWLSSPHNPLLTHILSPTTSVLELGCGISPLTALTLAPHVGSYTLSDQKYVHRTLQRNLDAHTPRGEVHFRTLDWEMDVVSESYHVVLATDCVYNDALVCPFVRTCADACARDGEGVCVVAQQLRSDGVFRTWLGAFMARFRVWRIDGLGEGFVVHVGVLRDRG